MGIARYTFDSFNVDDLRDSLMVVLDKISKLKKENLVENNKSG